MNIVQDADSYTLEKNLKPFSVLLCLKDTLHTTSIVSMDQERSCPLQNYFKGDTVSFFSSLHFSTKDEAQKAGTLLQILSDLTLEFLQRSIIKFLA